MWFRSERLNRASEARVLRASLCALPAMPKATPGWGYPWLAFTLLIFIAINTYAVLMLMHEESPGNAVLGEEAALSRLLATPPVSRGRQSKHAATPLEYWTKKGFEKRKAKIGDWLTEPPLGAALDTHLPVPYPHCQVYINHKYKYIWIKGHKVASTSMRENLGWLCGDRWKVPEDASMDLCADPLFNATEVTDAAAKALWMEYFVFAVVRNPFSWFASAQQYLNTYLRKGCRRPEFAESCLDPYLHARICRYNPKCCYGPNNVMHHIRHVMDQSTCIFTKDGKPSVDFIASVETLPQDFKVIASEINRRRLPGVPPVDPVLPETNKHRQKGGSSGGSQYAVEIYRNCRVCLEYVRRQYSRDFELLGYPAGISAQ